MKTILKYLCLCLLFGHLSDAQTKDDVLLQVDGDPVMASDFLRVYNKNLDLVKDENQKNVDTYLKLFTEYQLKLKEAKRLKLDEDVKYKREFLRYKKQLTKTYVSEHKVTDALVKEAYDRNKEVINAQHILVRLDEHAKDTIAAYNEVLKLRTRVLNEGFDTVKAEVHNGKTIFLEDLGYFSVFKMVYDFENAAYNTQKGEISMPFRTNFGYHVVKVNERRTSQGILTVAHIMVNLKQKDSLLNPEERINDIYKKLQQGEAFESLAKQFSDDKTSASKGGQIKPFKSGDLSSVVFEDAAFALTEDGQLSKPFKTPYGWHIVKRISLQPIASFETLKPTLETKVKRDSRSKLINAAVVQSLNERYNVVINPEARPYFKGLINNDFFKRTWAVGPDFKTADTLFTINNKAYTYNEFAQHLTTSQRLYINKAIPLDQVVDKEFDRFYERAIMQYREDNLENENAAFANILKEYRDGLLLFDLMEQEVWNKASKDSVGLANYYQSHSANYQWPDRVDLVMASSAQKAYATKALKMLKRGNTETYIKDQLNTDKAKNIIFTKGVYSIDDQRLPSNFKPVEGLSKVYKHNDAFHVIDVKQYLPAGPKTQDEAKGNVINDYQTKIETDWIETLYQRFDVKVNDRVLEDVKNSIQKQ